MVLIPPEIDHFQIDFEAFEKAVGPHTKGVVVNTPNNPSGVVYSKDTLERLAAVLTAKSQEYGHPIYLISDEPYREIVFQGFEVPWGPSHLPGHYRVLLLLQVPVPPRRTVGLCAGPR